MKRLQKGDIFPVADATVLKGHRSIIEMVSLVLKLAPGRLALSRAVMGGVKILSQVPCASSAVSSNGASSSKAVHNP